MLLAWGRAGAQQGVGVTHLKSNFGSWHPLQQTRMKYSLVLGFSCAEYFPFVPLLPPSHLSLLVRLHLQQFQISSQHPLQPLALLFIP